MHVLGKVHGSLARAGKVKGQTPKVSIGSFADSTGVDLGKILRDSRVWTWRGDLCLPYLTVGPWELRKFSHCGLGQT